MHCLIIYPNNSNDETDLEISSRLTKQGGFSQVDLDDPDSDKVLRASKDLVVLGSENKSVEYLKYHTPFEIHTIKCDLPAEYLRFYTLTEGGIYTLNENSDELAYLNLFRKVMTTGSTRSDRTGAGTISTFGERLEFDLTNNTIPLLTTKRVPFKTLAIELLWFISGSTNSKILEAQGVNIWKGNTSKEFLEKRGLPYAEGSIGSGYGFQWRHAGAKYTGMESDYTGQGVDQLQQLIDTLKTDPYSRRILMSAWNVVQLDDMCLPPCHLLFQLYVAERDGVKFLSSQVYMRSADSFIGVPLNIASYALLTHIIANIVGMKADKLTMVFGDYHIYNNHLTQVQEQLSRVPYAFPKIRFTRDLLNQSIDSVTLDDLDLIDYRFHPTIKAVMNI